MGIRDFIPTKANVSKPFRFDSLADAYYYQGGEVGCVVLHGFTGTPANVRVVAERLADAGYSVYAPLLSGHGTSLVDMNAQSDEIWLQNALDAYHRLRDAGCTKIVMMGLSMGGLLASIVAAHEACVGLALLCTPFRIRQYLRHAARMSVVFPYIILHTGAKHPRDAHRQRYSGAALRRLKDLNRLTNRGREVLGEITCPTLIVESAHDSRVDKRSLTIAKTELTHCDTETVMLYNSPHGCTYGPEKELVADYCLQFVQRVAKA